MTAAGGSRAWTFTVFKNGAATAVSCVIASAATTCNSANSVAFVPGDLIAVSVTLNGSGNPPDTNGFWTAQFTP